jgi:nucleoside-diphosphate-sugar epimerase
MAVKELIREVRPQIIFHMSSLATGARGMDFVAPIFEAEVVAALNVVMATANRPIERLIMCGSMEEPKLGTPPNSPYAAAKAASRLYADLFHVLYDTPIVNTRIFMAYGPGQAPAKFIPQAIDALARNEPLRVVSADRMIDWIYAADVAEGLLAPAVAPGLEGRSVDIGSGRLVAVRDILKHLHLIVAPKASRKVDFVAPRLVEEISMSDTAETKRLTGWEVRTSLEEGLRRTYAAWLEFSASSANMLRRQNASRSRRKVGRSFGWLVVAPQVCEIFETAMLWIN